MDNIIKDLRFIEATEQTVKCTFEDSAGEPVSLNSADWVNVCITWADEPTYHHKYTVNNNEVEFTFSPDETLNRRSGRYSVRVCVDGAVSEIANGAIYLERSNHPDTKKEEYAADDTDIITLTYIISEYEAARTLWEQKAQEADAAAATLQETLENAEEALEDVTTAEEARVSNEDTRQEAEASRQEAEATRALAIQNLDTTLATKADIAHTHEIEDVSGLQDALDSTEGLDDTYLRKDGGTMTGDITFGTNNKGIKFSDNLSIIGDDNGISILATNSKNSRTTGEIFLKNDGMIYIKSRALKFVRDTQSGPSEPLPIAWGGTGSTTAAGALATIWGRDTGWVQLTTNEPENFGTLYRKYGKLIFIKCRYTETKTSLSFTANTTIDIGTMPEGMRPTGQDVCIPCDPALAGVLSRVTISPAGAVQAYSKTTTSYMQAYGCYLID